MKYNHGRSVQLRSAKSVIASMLVAATLGAGSSSVWAQTTAPLAKPPVSVHPETTLARELLRLNQSGLLKTAAEQTAGTTAAGMFEAQVIYAKWSDFKSSRAKLTEMSTKYVRQLTAYLDSKPDNLDGKWALDEAKFIFAAPSEHVITRLEYFGTSEKDRRVLAPMAALADRMLKISSAYIDAQLTLLDTDAERRKYSNEDAYRVAYLEMDGAKSEVSYYQSWGYYFLAMSLDPRTQEPARKAALDQAIQSLSEWADGPDDGGVKNQSLLLRGKAYSEAGKIPEALKDLTAATTAKDEPNKKLDWVRYQAHYQLVVAQMRGAANGGGDFSKAKAELDNFKQWITSQNNAPEAQISAEMLSYRVAANEAASKKDPAVRVTAQKAAFGILSNILGKNPKFKDLVFEQVAAQTAEDQKIEDMLPLQALGLAWNLAQTPDDPPEAMKRALSRAQEAAEYVRKHKEATPLDQREATLVKAVASDRLDQWQQAAQLNLEFVTMAPDDPRSKDLVDQALANLSKLRKSGINTADIQALTQKALDLATGKFHDKRWVYARGSSLMEQGKLKEAQAVFATITAADDPSYYNAQYQIVLAHVQQGVQLAQKGAPPAEQKIAASALLTSCTQYLRLLSKAPEDVRKQMQSTLVDLRLIQIATAISPLDDAKTAAQGLDELERETKAANLPLTAAQRAGVLRYRIITYSKQGNSQGVADEIRKLDPKEAPGIIKNLVLANQSEIDNIETADPERAKNLAATVAELLGQLINLTKEPKEIYSYRQWRADMLARAGRLDDSMKLWKDLQNENNQDVANFVGEARAYYALKKYKEAQDYFMRIIPKLPIGSEAYWESFLRVIQCREALGMPNDDVKSRLKDLKITDPSNFGGKVFKKEYDALAAKYGV